MKARKNGRIGVKWCAAHMQCPEIGTELRKIHQKKNKMAKTESESVMLFFRSKNPYQSREYTRDLWTIMIVC